MGLLYPGMRIKIGPNLCGKALYDADDPEFLKEYLGQVVTVRDVQVYGTNDIQVRIHEDEDAMFFMEEIDGIVDDAEDEDLLEADRELGDLFEVTIR